MDIKKLTDAVRFRQIGHEYRIEQRIPANKLMNAYFELNYRIGELFKQTLVADKDTGDSVETLDLYCEALIPFFSSS